MHPLTVKHVCEIVDGTICGEVNVAATADGCVIDSRHVQQGDVFIALSGTQTHGVEYCTAALRDGAVVVIVEESVADACLTPHISVADAELALARLGWQNRQSSDALVVAVTGSVGKTTARRMIARHARIRAHGDSESSKLSTIIWECRSACWNFRAVTNLR